MLPPPWLGPVGVCCGEAKPKQASIASDNDKDKSTHRGSTGSVPRPYSGITFSLVTPALHTGHVFWFWELSHCGRRGDARCELSEKELTQRVCAHA